MTTARLKKSMDLKFLRVDHRFRQIDRRFAQIDRRFAQIDHRFEKVERRLDRIERTMATKEALDRSAAETRRHFDMVGENMRDDLRIFADAIGLNSERLNKHETRIIRLEQRSF